MNPDYFIDRFSKNRGVFESLLRGLSLEQIKWKPSPDRWSMLEVIITFMMRKLIFGAELQVC
jgi:ABC-type polysaccharide transport system permease subunit